MLASPNDEAERVRALLREQSLPDDIPLDFARVPAGAGGAYFPKDGVLALPVGATRLTILHEGAHAEHYRRSGISADNWPTDWASCTGMLLASEAYVGWRLSHLDDFRQSEREEVRQIGGSGFPATIGTWASLYETVADIRGFDYDGTLFSISGFRVLMRVLPLLVAERTAGDVILGADINAELAVPGESLRAIASHVTLLAMQPTRLVNLDAMSKLGEESLDELVAWGVMT